MCKRIFLIRALIKQLLTKYQIFTILPQISHFHKYRKFSSIFANFLDQLLHPYKFYGSDMSGILIFIFASCHPLNDRIVLLQRWVVKYHLHCDSYANHLIAWQVKENHIFKNLKMKQTLLRAIYCSL